MRIALIVLLPFLGAMLPPLLIRSGRNVCALVTGAVTASSLVLLLLQAPAVVRGEIVRAGIPWVPQIGLDLAFFVDGYGLFFAGLILFIGLLIIAYARWYLDREDPVGRFYAYLLLFQSAMLGIALSDNVLVLLVFWELTSLTSFLLIGYWRQLSEGRQGARMALLVTGSGGLCLIAGMLLLGQAAGTYQMSEILTRGDVIRSSPLYLPILLLVLGGAFTKSAQFPFHFWLPHAMAAPTPVSAYLHSATMVKAGIFLLGRLWPVLAGTDAWFLIVTGTGLVTMVIAAWIALYKDDLKALLAFSTVSHLGLITMLFGMGTPIAAVAAVFHILNHCTFKAALFLSAGIVDHETGTRDASRLGGLLRLMPITGTLAMIAAASMAGLPLLNGFLSKEMMLESAAHTDYLGSPWVVPALATLGALLSVAYSFRFVTAVFLGPPRVDYPRHPHDPPAGMWLPMAVLVVPVVLIGIAPPLVEPIVDLAARAVTGGALPDYHLALWHGVTPALFMTAVAVLGGALLLAAYQPALALRLALPRPEAKSIFDALIEALVTVARALTETIHNGSLQRSLLLAILVMLAVGGHAFIGGPHAVGTRTTLPVNLPAIALWLLVVSAALAVLRYHRQRLLALILTSIVGLVVALAFVYFSAPDLALTQLSVEVVTTVLMLLALNYLPQKTPPEPSRLRHWRDLAVAAAGGLAIAVTLYAVLTRDLAQTIASWQIAQSKPGGGGTNVVNVILVDFRGYDTFGEITVLGIAALAIFALLDSALSGTSGRRLEDLPHRREAGDRHPLMLVVVTRALLPLALTVGVYILLRGHNMPGGGFVAGLVIGVALIMQYMASGYAWAEKQLRIDYHALIGLGVLLAGITGVGAWYGNLPFLTSGHDYFHLPLVGEVELATAMAFDFGVFLTVVGVVMLTLANLSRVGRKAEPPPSGQGPMDIVLPAEGR
ncbi:MAG: monovalent cation/H+ antiporter subunit A [Geminicoccaceae bacterium]